MFWLLYLSHLIADYPFQTDRMVHLKRTWNGLFIHIGVHLAVLMAFTWGYWRNVLPYLIGLMILHYGIDTLKNYLRVRYPTWAIFSYFSDQFLHLTSIWLVGNWITSSLPGLTLPVTGTWMVFACGYLLGTHVWFITERIIFYRYPEYVATINAQYWSRLVVRALLLTVILLVAQVYTAVISFALVLPYIEGPYRHRVFWIDLAVAVACGVFVLWAV